MTQPPQHNPEDRNSPEPGRTPGLDSGGSVAPGDTPPTAGQMSGTAPAERKAPNMGPVSGNRTPMIIALVFIGVLVLAVLGYGIAEIGAYLTKEPGNEQSTLGAVVLQLPAA